MLHFYVSQNNKTIPPNGNRVNRIRRYKKDESQLTRADNAHSDDTRPRIKRAYREIDKFFPIFLGNTSLCNNINVITPESI